MSPGPPFVLSDSQSELTARSRKNPFRNGTTHILFSPLDFLSKLAAVVPRPHHNLIRYHGIFAPNARMRKLIVPTRYNKTKTKTDRRRHKLVAPKATDELIAPLSWAQRLKTGLQH
ncbi:MAG TPA: hypothetical protein EYQ14_29565 [Gammaproteobacteria bacterium]|nr:hypothetical protein [Gammaproteobacteria bacterium]HIL95280.1 hypothetical protein [Pseudomonadales bacterium]